MSISDMKGELIPVGGGDRIPLVKGKLQVGRRESCDIVLRFANVSAYHCELSVEGGYWFVKDRNSRNGTKVNGKRVNGRKRIDPGDMLAVARHKYTLEYSPIDLGATGPPPPDEENLFEVMSKSLLDRAGLDRQRREADDEPPKKRYDATNQDAGQIRDPNEPI